MLRSVKRRIFRRAKGPLQRLAPALPGQLPGICNRLTGYRLCDTRAAELLVGRRIEQGLRVASRIRRHSRGTDAGATIFEAGTGQNGVIPVLLWCLGCSRQTVTVDIVRNLNPWFIALQLDWYRGHRQRFGHLFGIRNSEFGIRNSEFEE